MTSSGLAIPVSVLRDAVEERVTASSLRVVATETGVPYSSLRHFLAGGKPHPETRKKLTTWYVAGHAGVQAEDALDILSMLISDIPPGLRGQALVDLLDSAARSYVSAGTTAPAWLARARALVSKTQGSASQADSPPELAR